MTTITPKHSLERVISHKTQPFNFIPFENKWQKFWLFSAIISLSLGAVIGIISKLSGNHIAGIFALFFLLFSLLLAVIYQVSVVFPLMKELGNSEKAISEPIVKEFDSDIELISEFSENYLEHHLEYAKNSFSLEANHLRGRISLLVGAIEKVGVFPLGVTAYLSIQKVVAEKVVVFSEIEVVLVALIVLYIFAIHMVTVSHKLERIVLIYDQALSLKRAKALEREKNKSVV